ncbi:MAG: MarR family transcriptional regulator [Candidatus Odinarchaeota archaeon]
MKQEDKTSDMYWERLGFAKAGKLRQTIVCLLLKSQLTPFEIAKETDRDPGSVSRVIKDLETNEIIKCMNPTAKKGKIFILTRDGEKIARELCRGETS